MLLIAALLSVGLALPALALEVPALKGRVNDYGGMLSPDAARILENSLPLLNRKLQPRLYC